MVSFKLKFKPCFSP